MGPSARVVRRPLIRPQEPARPRSRTSQRTFSRANNKRAARRSACRPPARQTWVRPRQVRDVSRQDAGRSASLPGNRGAVRAGRAITVNGLHAECAKIEGAWVHGEQDAMLGRTKSRSEAARFAGLTRGDEAAVRSTGGLPSMMRRPP